MALSAFDDKTKRPLENDLAAVLGKVLVRWNELKRLIASRFDPCSEEWGFTSKNTGWGLRLKHGKRIILYMTPCRGHFLASLALGEKAVKAARESNLPKSIMETIESARKYAEGRGIRLAIQKNASDVRNVVRLAVIKMSH
jgi:hypothetical protein